jgi:hypothetical protein
LKRIGGMFAIITASKERIRPVNPSLAVEAPNR